MYICMYSPRDDLQDCRVPYIYIYIYRTIHKKDLNIKFNSEYRDFYFVFRLNYFYHDTIFILLLLLLLF